MALYAYRLKAAGLTYAFETAADWLTRRQI
jgi:hypothetical protein